MIVTRKFGADAWNQIFRQQARVHPSLQSPLTASSQVPLVEFLSFHDELVDRLNGGDARSTYFELGEQSAGRAFVDGPCKNFIEERELGQVAKAFSLIWRAYYTERRRAGAKAKLPATAWSSASSDCPSDTHSSSISSPVL